MQIENPLVSIIVPVYNVENYLKRCLDSVIRQTYKNLQIILVDDGSVDMSGIICDRYAEFDARIRVLHTSNGGVAAARNQGLAIASGDLISFVDPDDWIEPNMIESLIEGVNLGADMAICGFYTNYSGEEIPDGYRYGWKFEKEKVLLDMTKGMNTLLSDEIPNFLWNKIYKRELFEQAKPIRFPIGVNYEDVAVMYLLVHRCHKIAFQQAPLYHYVYRSTGITGARKLSDFVDHCEIRIERYCWSQVACPDLCNVQCAGIADVVIRMVAATIRDKFLRKTDKHIQIENRKKRKILTDKLKNMNSDIYIGLDKNWKMIYRLCMMNTCLTDFIALGFELVRRKMDKKKCLYQ